MTASLPQELSREGTRNRDGVSCQNRELSQQALRLVEDPKLPQYRCPVIVDFFSGQAVIAVERVNPAKRKVDSSPRRRKTTPPAKLRTANHNFNNNGIVRDMPVLYFDFQVRQRLH